MGIDPAWIERFASAGMYPAETASPGPVEAEVSILKGWTFNPPATWVVGVDVPLEVPSLANERQWRARNRVAQIHRKRVSQAMGANLFYAAPFAARYHGGGKVLVVLTRLGGRRLDPTANLPASLKYVEDAVALMLGADDGDPRWKCECHQEPGGSRGVRIELRNA